MKEADLTRQYKAVVIGGSAGSFQVLGKILGRIPDDFAMPIIICAHRLKHIKTGFVEALSTKSIKKIEEPEDKVSIKKGKVYLAPANYHLSVELGNYFALSTEDMVNNSRPAIDLTLETAAYVYKEKLIGILLTGANKDGALGMKKIGEYGGMTIVQDPAESFIDTMPKAAINIARINYVLQVEQIIDFLIQVHKNQTKSIQ